MAVDINLVKPLGTDIYDISVFNDNFEVIENAIKALDNLKYNIVVNSQPNNNLIYGTGNCIIVNPVGFSTGIDSERGSNSFIVCTSSGTTTIPNDYEGYQTLFTNKGKIYQRYIDNFSGQYTATDWVEINEKTKVIDNLTSTDIDKALSANQGKVLDEKIADGLNSKLNIRYISDSRITLFPKTSGIYVCDGATVTSGDVPEGMEISLTDPTNNHFIIEVYGNLNVNSVLLYLTDINTGKRAIKRRLPGTGASWSDWEILN